MSIIIAVDAMGGDYGPSVTVPAAIHCLNQFPDVQIVLVGESSAIQPYLNKISKNLNSRISIQEAVADSNDGAARSTPDSPIAVGIDALKAEQFQAFVSAGHTSHLMAYSSFRLKRIPGVSRPVICSMIPCETGFSLLLDVGANLTITAENLYEFSLMGNFLAKALKPKSDPKVALLNIGVESMKGSSETKEAAELIKADQRLNYMGYIEGLDLFSGKADVIVCDGVTGNIALKASEGAALFVTHTLRKSIASSKFKKLAANFSAAIFKDVKERLNPQNFNGAVLLGVQGIVVKSHGHADAHGFSRALEHTVFLIKEDLLEVMQQAF